MEGRLGEEQVRELVGEADVRAPRPHGYEGLSNDIRGISHPPREVVKL